MGEVDVKKLTANQARELTDQVKRDVRSLRIHIAELYLGEADKALGYASWDEYKDAEFRDLGLALPREDRRAEVASLADMGYPTRAIAAAVGVNRKTVERDLEQDKCPIEDPQPEIVDAEIVEDRPLPRGPRTDIVGTMTSVMRRVDDAAAMAGKIKPSHLKGKGDSVEMWLRCLQPSVEQLNTLLDLLKGNQ